MSDRITFVRIHCHAPPLRDLLLTSPRLAFIRKWVISNDCCLTPDWAKGGIMLLPYDKEDGGWEGAGMDGNHFVCHSAHIHLILKVCAESCLSPTPLLTILST